MDGYVATNKVQKSVRLRIRGMLEWLFYGGNRIRTENKQVILFWVFSSSAVRMSDEVTRMLHNRTGAITRNCTQLVDRTTIS